MTWSYDDSEEDNEVMTANIVKALTVQVTEEVDSSDEEMNNEELADTYKLMFTNWKEMCVTCEKQKKIILDLTKENSDMKSMSMCQEHDRLIQILMVEKKKLESENGELQEEISLLEVKLESLNKSLRLLNSGTDALDDLLEASKQGKSKKGIGFDYSTANEEGQKVEVKFVVPQDRSEVAEKNFVVSHNKSEFIKHTDYQNSSKKSQHLVRHVDTQIKGLKQTTWICHYCGRYGHLRPYCYKLHGYPKISAKPQAPKIKNHKKKEWKAKVEVPGLIAHTSLRVSSKED